MVVVAVSLTVLALVVLLRLSGSIEGGHPDVREMSAGRKTPRPEFAPIRPISSDKSGRQQRKT